MMEAVKSIKAGRVLVDGVWYECSWIYPIRSLNSEMQPTEDSDPKLLPIRAMICGIALAQGWRYDVATAGTTYTVVIEAAFEGRNNLCEVVSLHARDAPLPAAGARGAWHS